MWGMASSDPSSSEPGHPSALREWRPGRAAWAESLRRRAGGTRQRPTQLLLLCTLLPVFLMSLSAWLTWREVWDRARVDVERSALAVAQYGERLLTLHAVAAGRMNGVLRGLSDAEIRDREAELHLQLRRLTSEILQTDAGHMLDRHGALLVSADVFPVPQAATAGAVADDFLALAAHGSSPIHVSRVHVSPTDGALSFAVSRRREGTGNDDLPPGRFDGLVSLAIFPDRVSGDLARLTADATDVAGLVRIDGELLARSPAFTVPTRVAEAVAAAIADGPASASVGATSVFDRSRFLVAAHRIAGWPVYATSGRPREAIVAEWRHAVSHQLAVGLPATFLLVGLAFAVRQGGRRLSDAKDLLEARDAARTAELAATGLRLERALRIGHVYAFEMDMRSRRVVRSANAAEVLGLPQAEAGDETVESFLAAVHPDDREPLRAAIAGATPGRPAYSIRFRYVRPDGRVACLQGHGAMQFGPDGAALRVSGLTRDVTAEVEADAARREAEFRLRDAIAGAGLGTYEIDFVRGMAWFDARASQVAGGHLPACEWFALDCPEWMALAAAIHPEDRAAFDKAWSDALTGKSDGWAVESRIRRADGAWVSDWCHGTVMERDPATGGPRRLVGVVLDVTERRQLEAELRHAQKLQALGALAGGIAHDFNNVLQAVSGAAAMIRRDAAEPALVERRGEMLADAVQRGASITGRLLAFARRGETRAVPLDPAEILLGLREMLGPALGAHIAIRVEAEPGLPPVVAEREQLQTALINLTVNARDAMSAGGVLTLAARSERVEAGSECGPDPLAPGEYVRLSVRDTGEGMDAATLARAAEPFFTTKPEGVGTGLGLPMAKVLARHCGGGFAIESAPGRGTTVTLWLPKAGEPAGPGPADAQPAADAGPLLRIMVVDDERLVRETLAELFHAAGHAVRTAASAEEALRLLDAGEAVDALVTDLVMPGPSGLALIEAARRRRPGLPAVLLTGTPEAVPDTLCDAAEQGGLAVLRKPVSAGEVIAALAAIRPPAGS
jgi:PAS domain S-box-containing protein